MSRRGGFFWRRSSACFSARLLCLLLSFGLLMLTSPIFALTQSERLNNIESRLQNMIAYSQKLGNELENSQTLTQQKQQIIDDQLRELATLKSELESWKTSDEQKAKRIAELLSIIDGLQEKLQQLSESCENIARPLREALKLAEKEIRKQKIEKWLFGIGAGLVGLGIGFGIGQVIN